MALLTIQWQRLVENGQTCPRCGDTGEQVRDAALILGAALAPKGIQVRLVEVEIPMAEFEKAPLESNRILIEGRSVEDWLGGTTGQSACCDVCGPNDCRTIVVDGRSYEAIPAELIVRAGLVAAARGMGDSRESACGCGPATGNGRRCCG